MELPKRKRRANINADEVLKMQELEKSGKTRKEIATELGCHPAVVTRQLGTRTKVEEEVSAPE